MTAAVPARPDAVLADLIPGTVVRDVALVAVGAGFVGLAAQVIVHLPGTPVPVTGQTLAVLLTGTALGWRRAFAALTLYLVAGVVGVPWFAGHASGAAGASFGYVIGFAVAAPIVGALARRGADRTPLRTLGSMVVGNAVIYLFGVAYLAADLHVGAGTAVHLGLRPFLVGDAAKALVAAALLPGTWKLVERTRG
jgi:biotin transport system substrate-specific component